MLRNSQASYGLIAKLFHWLSAISVLVLFCSGIWMVDLDYDDYWYDAATHYHESLGILLLALFILRLLWRWLDKPPALSTTLTAFESSSAHLAHFFLYLLPIIVLVSGYLISATDIYGVDVFNWFTAPSLGSFHHLQADFAGKIHYWFACTLMLLMTIHIFAALKHHFIDNDNTLNKIL